MGNSHPPSPSCEPITAAPATVSQSQQRGNEKGANPKERRSLVDKGGKRNHDPRAESAIGRISQSWPIAQINYYWRRLLTNSTYRSRQPPLRWHSAQLWGQKFQKAQRRTGLLSLRDPTYVDKFDIFHSPWNELKRKANNFMRLSKKIVTALTYLSNSKFKSGWYFTHNYYSKRHHGSSSPSRRKFGFIWPMDPILLHKD